MSQPAAIQYNLLSKIVTCKKTVSLEIRIQDFRGCLHSGDAQQSNKMSAGH